MNNVYNVIPMVIEQSSRGERAYDIFSLLLRDRIVLLGTGINDQVANLIVAQLLYLQHTDPERQDPAVKADDEAAIELLAKRKLDAAERTRLKGRVQVALGPTSILPAATTAQGLLEQRNTALVALRAWYDEWASTAKTVIKKRGHLIRLGLATRKKAVKKAKKPATPAAPVTGTPKPS